MASVTVELYRRHFRCRPCGAAIRQIATGDPSPLVTSYNSSSGSIDQNEPNNDGCVSATEHRCETVEVQLEIGHTATLRRWPTADGRTHDWSIYLRSADSRPATSNKLEHFIERVEFHLHDSFDQPRHVVKEPPFHVSETGYGTFILPIDIYFRSSACDPQRLRVLYELVLDSEKDVANVRYEKLVFWNPPEPFRNNLVNGGGVVYVKQRHHTVGATNTNSQSAATTTSSSGYCSRCSYQCTPRVACAKWLMTSSSSFHNSSMACNKISVSCDENLTSSPKKVELPTMANDSACSTTFQKFLPLVDVPSPNEKKPSTFLQQWLRHVTASHEDGLLMSSSSNPATPLPTSVGATSMRRKMGKPVKHVPTSLNGQSVKVGGNSETSSAATALSDPATGRHHATTILIAPLASPALPVAIVSVPAEVNGTAGPLPNNVYRAKSSCAAVTVAQSAESKSPVTSSTSLSSCKTQDRRRNEMKLPKKTLIKKKEKPALMRKSNRIRAVTSFQPKTIKYAQRRQSPEIVATPVASLTSPVGPTTTFRTSLSRQGQDREMISLLKPLSNPKAEEVMSSAEYMPDRYKKLKRQASLSNKRTSPIVDCETRMLDHVYRLRPVVAHGASVANKPVAIHVGRSPPADDSVEPDDSGVDENDDDDDDVIITGYILPKRSALLRNSSEVMNSHRASGKVNNESLASQLLAAQNSKGSNNGPKAPLQLVSDAQPIKRKRGRPRKYPIPYDGQNAVASSQVKQGSSEQSVDRRQNTGCDAINMPFPLIADRLARENNTSLLASTNVSRLTRSATAARSIDDFETARKRSVPRYRDPSTSSDEFWEDDTELIAGQKRAGRRRGRCRTAGSEVACIGGRDQFAPTMNLSLSSIEKDNSIGRLVSPFVKSSKSASTASASGMTSTPRVKASLAHCAGKKSAYDDEYKFWEKGRMKWINVVSSNKPVSTAAIVERQQAAGLRNSHRQLPRRRTNADGRDALATASVDGAQYAYNRRGRSRLVGRRGTGSDFVDLPLMTSSVDDKATQARLSSRDYRSAGGRRGKGKSRRGRKRRNTDLGTCSNLTGDSDDIEEFSEIIYRRNAPSQARTTSRGIESASTSNKLNDKGLSIYSADNYGCQMGRRRQQESAGTFAERSSATSYVINGGTMESDAVASGRSDFNVLVKLQRQLSLTTDVRTLNSVVEVIEQSGKYRLEDASFDFDLCSLDGNTIAKLRQCLGV